MTIDEDNRHSSFWFEDGNLILHVQNCAFKIHKDIFSRHSRLSLSHDPESTPKALNSADNGQEAQYLRYVVPPERGVTADDVAVLLDYIYSNPPLSPETPLSRLVSLIRVSSTGQLDLPTVHTASINQFVQSFPDNPTPAQYHEDLIQALLLALEFQIVAVQKRLFYSFVVASNLDLESFESIVQEDKPGGVSVVDVPSTSTSNPTLSPLPASQIKRCNDLMTKMVEHFTPLLFSPATTPHMACTDVFADTWMNLVIQPAIEDDGVCKPLETLERIKGVDWAAHGLCAECVREKRAEWNDEQVLIWNLMDEWLAVGPLAV
ncbi:hypothetical protein PLEOSDRAFT_1099122 [Pleurotus ostreatus PC15]|uniref:BTB domain-containing protein n=1 Tax=Pleurotus ostreatus (strain PC15) TaxID=1137138 RepID=A0A067NYJ3_PLEO1|nr:hypothetical protein PLEOSDRAFT_1099122 [Pleurotus ostreatus PC15]